MLSAYRGVSNELRGRHALYGITQKIIVIIIIFGDLVGVVQFVYINGFNHTGKQMFMQITDSQLHALIRVDNVISSLVVITLYQPTYRVRKRCINVRTR